MFYSHIDFSCFVVIFFKLLFSYWIDFIISGELSPPLNTRLRSDDSQQPARKHAIPDNTGRASYHVRFSQHPGKPFPPDVPPKQKLTPSYEGARPFSRPIIPEYKEHPFPGNKGLPCISHSSSKLSTFVALRQLSVTSMDDDASTTTSGSYVINPDEVRMDTFIGADVIV